MQRQVNQGTRKAVKIFLACICIVVLMWSLCACDPGPNLSPRGLITPSQALYDELDRVNAADVPAEAQPEGPTIHIVLDSSLGDYNGGEGFNTAGFLSERCVTFQSVMAACSGITSGQDYYGYISCLENDSGPALEGKWAGAAAGTYFQPLADFYTNAVKTSAYSQHNSDLVGLVSDVASCAGEPAHEGDVFILISDLAMRDVGESNDIAAVLKADVIESDALSMGIVGIQADYAGLIRNVPSTSVGIEPRRVFGTAGNTSQVYQRPLYLLFIGDKTNVLSVMDQFLQACSEDAYLSEDGQTNSLYYYKLCCRPADESGGVDVTFTGNIGEYGTQGYDPAYVFDLNGKDSDLDGKDSDLDGKDSELDKYRDVINDIEIAKMYKGQRGESDGNLAFSYRFPYEIVTSPSLENGVSRALGAGAVFDFAENNPNVEVAAKQLKYNASEIDSTYPSEIVGWETAAQDLFIVAQPQFDGARQTAEILCTIDVSQLQQDAPAIFSLTFHSEYMPDKDTIRAVYDTDWMEEWTMDMGVYQTQWAEKAFLFTEATKTAYFANTFVSNLLNCQINRNIKTISEQFAGFDQTVLCGVVIREQAASYLKGEKESPADSDNLGWAYSYDETLALSAGN